MKIDTPMKRQGSKQATLERDLDVLLDDLCREWGFCTRLNGRQLIAETGSIDAETFAQAVLVAEGLNPEYEVRWMRNMKRVFSERYGSGSISVSSYEAE